MNFGMRAALLLSAAIVVVCGAAGCGADRGDYVTANERLFRELPTFPGAQYRHDIALEAPRIDDELSA